MKLKAIATALTTITGVLLASQALAVTGKLMPENGVFLSIGQDVDSINDYKASLNRTPAGVVNYVGIENLDGLTTNADAGAGRNNIAELAATYPDSALVIGVSMNGVVDQVAAGNYNNNIDTLLNTLGGYNRPVYLRWAYEVDGPWNGHNQTDLKASFRYVHQRIIDLGYADRIAMVWQVASYCPNQPGQLESWYPGNDVVDWIGLSYFAPQDCNWARVNEAADFARAKDKPLFINESTPQRYQTSDLNYSADPAQGSNRQSKTAQQIWNEWYTPFFNFMNTYSDVLKGVTYINADWDNQTRWGDFGDGYGEGYWGDSRVQVNQIIENNWLSEVNKAKYIKLDSNLYSNLGFPADTGNTGGNPGDGNPGDGNPGGNPGGSCADDFGIAYVNDNTLAVYLKDENYRANFNYACLDGYCVSGTLQNGYWVKEFSASLGTSYAIQYKIDAVGFPGNQLITDKTATFSSNSCTL